MSHTINITRRITTTTTTVVTRGSVMGLNTDYIKKIPGILQLVEWIIGAVVIGLCAHSGGGYTYVCLNHQELFLMNIAITCLITTLIILVASLLHQPTAQVLPKTLFELLYHCLAFLLYLAGSITVLVAVNRENYRSSRYTELLIAAIFALVNTILYFISAIYSFKSFRGEKMEAA